MSLSVQLTVGEGSIRVLPLLYAVFFIEILYITNKMRLTMIFIVTNALHVSGFNVHHQELMNCICSLWYSEWIYVVIGSYRNYSLRDLQYALQFRFQCKYNAY